jgi:signal transduction histidine kinase
MLSGSPEAENGQAQCPLCHGACKVRACLTGESVSGPFECEFAAHDHRRAQDTTMAPTYGRHVAFRLTPVDGPERRQVLLVGRDITDERVLEKQRLAILRELTHEVRQPLTVARSNLESALHYSSPDLSLEERQRKERLAVRGIVQASAVVADIQALFERMVGQFTVDPELGDLSTVARLAADEVESLARHYGVRLLVDAPANLPLARIDPKRAEQVARNQQINALQFTPAGGEVTISTRAGSGKDASWVILMVEDTGPGIPHDSLPYIFDRYYQAGTPLAEGRPKGSGLGLAVVRYIMQGHHGDHWAENRANGGACFIMRFPRA